MQVVDYKGVTGSRKFVPFSEYNMFRFGNGHSAYFNADILQTLRRHLDLGLETSLGYFYTDIFRRHVFLYQADAYDQSQFAGRKQITA